jgi:hypothetical protein
MALPNRQRCCPHTQSERLVDATMSISVQIDYVQNRALSEKMASQSDGFQSIAGSVTLAKYDAEACLIPPVSGIPFYAGVYGESEG